MKNYHFLILDIKLNETKLKDLDIEFVDVFDISKSLRERGWLVPAYNLPNNAEDIAVLRIVIKENFTRDMADLLVNDIKNIFKKYKKDFDEHANEKEPSINIF